MQEEDGTPIEYDVIILGTGLKECILSGLLSKSGKKVLHMDKNDFYGAESASFNITQANEALQSATGHKEKMSEEDYKAHVGRGKEFNIDLCPKFLMAGGTLVKILLKTGVTKYLEFKSVGGSYLYSKSKGEQLHEVPMTAGKAWNSKLMDMMAKKRFGDFLNYVNNLEVTDPSTWKASGLGWSKSFDLKTVTPKDVFAYFKLTPGVIEFLGHAVCLYPNNDYLTFVGENKESKMLEVCERMKLYLNSISIYKDTTSPYLYPMWGLGGLPEGFSRLAAVYGGVYMLRRPVEEILYDDAGKVKGVVSKGETAHCKQLICDPFYLNGTEKVQSTGYIARTIMVLDGKMPFVTKDDESAQCIFPMEQVGHTCDIYLTMVGKDLECAPQNKYVAVASTKVGGAQDMMPLEAVRSYITKNGVQILEEWHTVRETFVGANKEDDEVFVCSSPDETTHFQNATREVMEIYQNMTKEPLDLTDVKGEDED